MKATEIKNGDFIKGGKGKDAFEGVVKQLAPYPNSRQVLIEGKSGEQFVKIDDIVAIIHVQKTVR